MREVFTLVMDAERNADALAQATGLVWGFAPFDVRFLSSLRDQQRPLTRSQLGTFRTMMMGEAYITQVALLW